MTSALTNDDVPRLDAGQLAAYFARIGISRPAKVDFEALAAIQYAHLMTFTWEAMDAFMGWPSSVDPQDAFAKLVEGKRGGWCYEMNGLLGAALAAFGFRVTRLCGAVNREHLGDVAIGNHLALRVDLDQPYIVEVGLGDSVVAPIPLKIGSVAQRGFKFEIVESGDGWLRFRNHALGLARSFDFQPERRDEAAIATAHRWLSEDPASPFVGTLALFRHFPEGYLSVRNDILRRDTPAGAVEQRIASVEEYAQTLSDVFGVRVAFPSDVWQKIQAARERSEAA